MHLSQPNGTMKEEGLETSHLFLDIIAFKY